MKTRYELILDFMLALAANSKMTPPEFEPAVTAEMIYCHAAALADEYLENL